MKKPSVNKHERKKADEKLKTIQTRSRRCMFLTFVFVQHLVTVVGLHDHVHNIHGVNGRNVVGHNGLA